MKTKIKMYCLSRTFTAGALAALFIIFLLLFLLVGPDKKRVILFFPTDDLVSVAGDHHVLPRKSSLEDDMRVLLAEALLQPYDYHLNKTVPEGVVINSFIYDKEKDVLYVDLSLDLISVDDDDPRKVDGDRMLGILEKNLRFNFRRLVEVKFTVDGQVPHSYVFTEASS